MRKKVTTHIDEAGRLVVPAAVAEAWGLKPGDALQLEDTGSGLQLRPPITSLRRAYIELTNQCNLNCSTCMRNVWNVTAGYMSEAVFQRILDELAGVRPLPEVFFGGYGEPLSHPACLRMLTQAKARGFPVSLITNGILLTKEVAHHLIDLPLDRLWVSLDGASPECYADVRLGNALPLILENLTRFRELQCMKYGLASWQMLPRLGIAFVAMQRNIQDLPNVIRLGRQLGAVEFSITNVLAHDRQLRDQSLYAHTMDRANTAEPSAWAPLIRLPGMDIDSSTARVLVELLKGSHRVELTGTELGQNVNRCPFIERGSLSIRWDGLVSPCLPLLYTHTYYLAERQRTSHEYFVGNILERSLAEIWNHPAYLALRQRLQDFDFAPCTICNSCEMADANLEDCFGNTLPACGGCLWAQGLIRCP